jgi:hypothetical protein
MERTAVDPSALPPFSPCLWNNNPWMAGHDDQEMERLKQTTDLLWAIVG